jgi:LuxR family maltose regulon positive regulatory protein
MMMTLPLQDTSNYSDHPAQAETRLSSAGAAYANTRAPGLHLLADKLRIPRFEGVMARERLDEILGKSCLQFGATLLSGRAGTGKTVAAASFASRYSNVAWYSVESVDSDWAIFSHYLNAALMKTPVFGRSAEVSIFEDHGKPEGGDVSIFLSDLFGQVETAGDSPLLIVLDNVQHLFDARWFNDFFSLLVQSLVPDIHLLMLCRGKPPLPLWRLRSKQRLAVVDEKLLAFSPDETERLYHVNGLSGDIARRAQRDSFGRASKLALFMNAEAGAVSAP